MKKIEDYCKENGDLDEEKFIEDITQIFIPIMFKEEKIKKVIEKAENEEVFEIIIEYYTKRKELADEYVKKIEESK